jgi:hypothetical protein
LKFGGIKGETGTTIVVAQEQALLQEKKNWKKICKVNVDYVKNKMEVFTT